MSLRKSPQITSPLIAANRQNAQHSTGPRTPKGKARSGTNALRHGLCAALSESTRQSMLALGEDPEQFERLYADLLRVYEPGDALGVRLVEDLAHLYWRRQRLDRARDALLRHRLELLDLAHERRRQKFDREALAPEDEARVAEVGLDGMKDSAAKFRQMLASLASLVEALERRDVSAGQDAVLAKLYGKELHGPGRLLQQLFSSLLESHRTGKPLEDETCQQLRSLLADEMRRVRQEHELFHREQVELTPSARQAGLAPMGREWTWILRQENALDRAIDRKVKLLMELLWTRTLLASEAARSAGSPPQTAHSLREAEDAEGEWE